MDWRRATRPRTGHSTQVRVAQVVVVMPATLGTRADRICPLSHTQSRRSRSHDGPTVGPALATRAASSRSAVTTVTCFPASAARCAWRTISLSPSFGACTTLTWPSRPAATPPLASPSRTSTMSPSTSAVISCSWRRRAAPARSFHHPSGRAPTTLAPSTTTTVVAARLTRGLLEELGEVLGQVERGRGLLVVDLLAVGVAERVGGRRALGLRRLGLLRGLGGVAAHPATLARLVLRRLLGPAPLAATGHPRHPRDTGHAAALGEGLHHLAGLEEAVDEAVDVGVLAAGALGDPGAAGAVDHLGVGPLGRRHRLDDRLDPVDLALVEVLELVLELPHPGQHPHDLGHRPELADLLHLLEEVVEGELAALSGQLVGCLEGLLLVEGLLGLLDQGHHVTHVEDPRSHPVGVEDVEVGELLAGRGEHDRLAGHTADGQPGTTAGVAVELGENDAVVADTVEERLRRGDGVLADHRVDDVEDLVGTDRVADVSGLLHQLGIDAEAAGGVDDHHVVELAAGLVDRVARDLHRVADAVAGLRREHRYAGPVAVDLELVDRVRALEVGRDQHRLLALLLEPERELGGERGLAGALEAGQHDHRRRVLGVAQPAGLAAEDGDQLVVDDLDDLLSGVQRLADLFPASAFLDRVDELTHHRQCDVGLEQSDPDLARGRVDVCLGEAALAA